MKYLISLMLIVLATGNAISQISLIGGMNVNFEKFNPRRHLLYFGGVEVKKYLKHDFKLYAAPHYAALNINDRRFDSAILPLGISYQVNPMWDERTPLFRIVDVNLGAYGGYVFNVKYKKEDITDNFRHIDYGLHFSVKMRLFIFYPLYISYIHGFADLDRSGDQVGQYMLQLGGYFPISTILRDY